MKKFDQFLSMLILLAYAILVGLSWVLMYLDLEPWVMNTMDIMRTSVLCAMFVVVAYNACGWTDSWMMRIIFIALTAFLIATAVAIRVPEVAKIFNEYNIPYLI